MNRGSGVLFHLTSLPSAFGIGDLGPVAYQFADFLHESGQRYWQMLPLNPTNPVSGNSPYQSISAFACNPLLLSPEIMIRDGFLLPEDLGDIPDFQNERVDYETVTAFKEQLFSRACNRFEADSDHQEYEGFCSLNSQWLDDVALFSALKSRFHGQVWTKWPRELRDRRPEALERAIKECEHEINREKCLQYFFFRQWRSFKNYCNDRGIRIIGDIPIYVVHDSADVWVYPHQFNLDSHKRPKTVAGVPPDYFSDTGQLWGNPVYRWDVLKETGYEWWIQRIAHNLTLFDLLRVDHFRGFVGYWEVPAGEKDAVRGRWINAPAGDFFETVLGRIPNAPIIAEDLGVITTDVKEIIHRFNFPGMKILMFAFGKDLPANPYAPHNHIKHCLVYTGTHDNNTAKGWFQKETTPEDKNRIFGYLGREVTEEEIPWELIRLAMMSVADTAIFPMQDLLGLGEDARMNRPARGDGNWQWRLLGDHITPGLARKLRKMTDIYGRL
jgi:4-alpha-glucanotransferase